MAVDPKRRFVTLTYEEGSARMARGVAEFFFGAIASTGTWKRSGQAGQDGKNKVPYGRAQQSLCAGGKAVVVHMANGDKWTMRVTGPDKRYLDWFLEKTIVKDDVVRVTTPRGTKYGETIDLIATV